MSPSISRRELFGFLRRAPESAREPAREPAPEPAAFSLDDFYRTRGSTTPGALPVFALRAPEAHATTRVGAGPMARADRAANEGAPAAPAIAIAATQVPSVIESACLATRSFCSVCVERCPRPGAIVVERGRPRVVPDACDGCGRCVAACPAPVLAFALVARTPGRNEASDV